MDMIINRSLKQLSIALLFLTLTISAAFLFRCCTAVKAQDKALTSYNEVANINKLERLNEEGKKKFLDDITGHRGKVEASLTTLLDSQDNNVKCYAAFLLGWYRFENAVNPLSEIITLKDKARRASALWWWGEYPAVGALIDIGAPSLPQMIKNLETSDDAEVRQLSMDVINAVNRQDKALSKFMIERAIAAQTDKAKQERLKKSLDLLAQKPG